MKSNDTTVQLLVPNTAIGYYLALLDAPTKMYIETFTIASATKTHKLITLKMNFQGCINVLSVVDYIVDFHKKIYPNKHLNISALLYIDKHDIITIIHNNEYEKKLLYIKNYTWTSDASVDYLTDRFKLPDLEIIEYTGNVDTLE